MRRGPLVLALVALGLLFGTASPVLATSFDNRPKILLHVKSKTSKNPCNFGSLSDCQTQTVVKGTLTNPNDTNTFYFVYLLAVKASLPNMAGIQCGIQYDGGANPSGTVPMISRGRARAISASRSARPRTSVARNSPVVTSRKARPN